MPDRGHPNPPPPAPEPIPDPVPDRVPILRRSWLCRFRDAEDREALEGFELLLYRLASEATAYWGDHPPLPAELRAAATDLASVAYGLSELPESGGPLRRRVTAWVVRLAALVDDMDGALQDAEPEPPGRAEGTGEPPALLEDVEALLRLAARIGSRAPSVEAALRAADRELFRWASMAECVRHDLYGEGIGGTLEEPLEDSVLGRVAAMTAWPSGKWAEHFENELADLEGER